MGQRWPSLENVQHDIAWPTTKLFNPNERLSFHHRLGSLLAGSRQHPKLKQGRGNAVLRGGAEGAFNGRCAIDEAVRRAFPSHFRNHRIGGSFVREVHPGHGNGRLPADTL